MNSPIDEDHSKEGRLVVHGYRANMHTRHFSRAVAIQISRLKYDIVLPIDRFIHESHPSTPNPNPRCIDKASKLVRTSVGCVPLLLPIS